MSQQPEHLQSDQPQSVDGPDAGATRAGAPDPQPHPLLPGDPPRIGDFWLDARLTARESGVVYLGHADDSPTAMVLVLSEGAAHDPAARQRLAGEVNKLHDRAVVARGGHGQDTGRLAHKFRSEADDPVSPEDPPMAPWVALAYDGSPAALAEADRLLRSVDLSSTPLIGAPAGPDYRLHWLDDARPGAWRLWPASWPGRHDRAGWVPFAVAWAIVIGLCGLALLIAVLLFQNAPAEQPQPPVTQSNTESSQSGSADRSQSPAEQSNSESAQSSSSPSGSSASQSPSDSSSQSQSPSGSGSSGSQSQSPSDSGSSDSQSAPGTLSPSKTPSMGTSGEGSATDTQPPPVNSRL